MNTKYIKKFPTSEEIKKEFPLSQNDKENIAAHRQKIKNILANRDKRLILVIGPCSAWPEEAFLDYAKKVKTLSEELSIKNKLKLILRVYSQKPRTVGGWAGSLNQPSPFLPPDIEKGARYVHALMMKIVKMNIPIANEILFTHASQASLDLMSWAVIGARSAEDPEHRVFASGLDTAVGMKNPTSGSIKIGVNSVAASQISYTAVFYGNQVETAGNAYANLIIRGGSNGPNYHAENLFKAKKYLTERKVTNPTVVIDASHDNSIIDGEKDYNRQINVIHETLDNMDARIELKNLVKGFMIESFIKDGNQSINKLTRETVDMSGLSITDTCIGWEKTEKLIRDVAQRV